ncbi:hypothetical protein [Streptomyces sp. NPDC005017]|uniref:hypothetical protein n=1 Tax=Streptomyces sp. NPDC005017 TaxID=3364706 RepID=UPI00368DB2A7
MTKKPYPSESAHGQAPDHQDTGRYGPASDVDEALQQDDPGAHHSFHSDGHSGGEGTGRAEENAARTVNRERARSGESKTANKTSTRGPKSASQRGGQRSHGGAQGPTKDQLYQEAKKRNIHGRASMSKEQLENALGR